MADMRLIAFEDRYMELFWKKERYYWENYTDNAKHDLNGLDEEFFYLANEYRDMEFSGRKGTVTKMIITRDLIDKHPDVAVLRNRLDDLDNYSQDCPVGLDSDSLRVIQAKRMRNDVLELMHRRESLAKEYEFTSYPHMVLWCDEVELDWLLNELKQFLEENLPITRKILKKFSIDSITDLSRLHERKLPSFNLNPHALTRQLLQQLGYVNIMESIRITVNDGDLWGYVGVISIPDYY